ncbi:hydrogenase maturation protein HypD [Thermodesulfitimonas autotrophica]|uniref:Hydrogenase maturation protein HypD n=1 Tax=Thermodesulfitimonas autotrophica TaxID=1894989 RepID=A0A3N5AP88_9THEO|nr:hydrogenase formation protein HypD [Thermodesulfitimonas autotrophica]RPF46674.1 hydrogenase maturation protein HypD [Thermodesulfitimonas autotrophica]
MREFLTKFRDPEIARALIKDVRHLATRVADRLGRRVVLMEVCGTHTVAISRAGLRSLLGDLLDLRSGPGCPVCVTDYADVDRMVALARLPGVTVGTFGDMVRVPGSDSSLERERAAGADIRIFYSPADAVAWAAAHPERELVFLGVGFETTAPAVALSIKEAGARGLKNFSVYVNHKLVPPALMALLEDPEIKVDGFILPGHVSAIIGRRAYSFLEAFRLPAAITGFETNDILEGIRQILKMMWGKEPRVVNGYTRVVREEGNKIAQREMAAVFRVGDASWRGFGVIPGSGLTLAAPFAAFDAAARFTLPPVVPRVPAGCACGEILKGKLTPKECRLFAVACNPTSPVGPCMVSSEGACAAYYQFERHYGERANHA